MGRRSRRFAVRGTLAVLTLAGGWASYHRWQLRRSAVVPLTSIEKPLLPPQTRFAKLQQLERVSHNHHHNNNNNSNNNSISGSIEDPFDVLIVGGGATGLYTAVDAAQRGLRVAVVDADDFGSAATRTSPPVIPGAFPYIQRALRQRDGRWLYRAAEAMEALTVWSHVIPPEMMESYHIPTLICSSHMMELVEFTIAATIATVLSPFCGVWKSFRFLRGSLLQQQLGKTEDEVKGGIIIQDAQLNGAAVSIALARTAEALGAFVLNYTSVTQVKRVNAIHSRQTEANFAVSLNDVSAPNSTTAGGVNSQTYTVYTRSIVNCAGSWVDEVKQLIPDNASDAVPSAIERHQVSSYIVVPRSAVRTRGEIHNRDIGNSFSILGVKAMLLSSTLYSFSSVMVLPWFDDCVLIGPSVTPLSHLPSKTTGTIPTMLMTWTDNNNNSNSDSNINTSKSHVKCSDAYEIQQDRILKALQASGVIVEKGRMLSIISSIVPILRAPSLVPWGEDILIKGYHITAGTSQPHVVHIYGGTLCFARDIAEEAVNHLLRESGTFTETEVKRFYPCRTKRLQLFHDKDMTPTTSHHNHNNNNNNNNDNNNNNNNNDISMSPMERVRRLVHETYAVRVVDVLARRTHVAYSSPAEAAAAIKVIAIVMQRELGWNKARTRAEMDFAQAYIRSVAVV